jgi:hypothetical protein
MLEFLTQGHGLVPIPSASLAWIGAECLGWRPQLSDAGDELVFEAAVNGRADALVTYNIRHFAAASVRFGLRIMRPVEALEEMTR